MWDALAVVGIISIVIWVFAVLVIVAFLSGRNCLSYAVRRYRRYGGYLVIRRARIGGYKSSWPLIQRLTQAIPHFLWIADSDTKPPAMRHYTLRDGLHAHWWDKGVVRGLFRLFSFDGIIKTEDE